MSAVINGTHYWAGRYCPTEHICEQDSLEMPNGKCGWCNETFEGPWRYTCPRCSELTTNQKCEHCGAKVVLF